MRAENRVHVTINPEQFHHAKFQRTLLYEHAIADGAPIEWKEGKAPKFRDATEKDIVAKCRINIQDSSITCVW